MNHTRAARRGDRAAHPSCAGARRPSHFVVSPVRLLASHPFSAAC